MKKQFKDILTHPLLFEIGVAYHTERPLAGKAAVEKWKKFQAGEKPEEVEEPILDLLSNDYLFYNGGASIGNVSWAICDYASPFLIVFYRSTP